VTSSRALGRDRVIEITFRREIGAGFSQVKSLVFEASGRYSNLILLDGGVVVESAKHIHPETNRYRSIVPGVPYVMPPPIAGAVHPGEIGAFGALDRISGIGKPLIEAIKKKYGASGEAALNLIRSLDSEDTPLVFQKLGGYVTAFPALLDGAKRIETTSSLAAARECVITPLLARHAQRAKRRVAAKIEQLARVNAKKIAEAEAMLEDESAAERLMRCGQLILANSWRIPPRSDAAELPEWTEEGEITRRVELDPNRDAAGNAERYFARYRKKRAAVDRSRKILPALYLERDGLTEQEALLNCHTDAVTILMMMDELSPREAQSGGKRQKARKAGQKPPHGRFEFPEKNAVMLVGLSALGNHYVTFRLSSGDDIWLHAQGTPGAHVILRFTSKPDAETYGGMLGIAASAAAFHSKARESGRVRVDYTERKYVRPIPGTGPAHVAYSEFSTVFADTGLWLDTVRR
jgi:predicted ribosome quality control (RQC) complex YloA/Tae2 family protein